MSCMKEVAQLEARLTGPEGVQHLNEIGRLYEIAESQDLRLVAEALKAVPRVLAHHRQLCRGDATGSADVLEWLRGHSEAYHAALSQLAASKNPRAQACGVRLAFAAIQDEADQAKTASAGVRGKAGGAAAAPETRVQALLTTILLSKHWASHAAECIMSEYVGQYADIRHYVLQAMRSFCEQAAKAVSLDAFNKSSPSAAEAGDEDVEGASGQQPPAKRRRKGMVLGPFAEGMVEHGLMPEAFFVRVLAFLKEAPEPPPASSREAAGDGDDDTPDVEVLAPAGRPSRQFVRDYRKVFQNAWLQLLHLRAPLDQCKAMLQLVPARVMPHMSQPLMLADFYLQAFNSGSAEVAVLSLSGLFLLLTRHGLGDPDALSDSSGEYYSRLYGLLTAENLKLKQRARFQRLLATSLLSGLLPARFAAAFSKKCMRLAATCSDHGTVMWLMSIAYTLIQKHHSHCRSLLHRSEAAETAAAKEPSEDSVAADAAPVATSSKDDPFDVSAPMTAAAEQASKSSLWEIKLLCRHHVPAVSTVAKLFLKPFFKPSAKKLDPEDFLDQSATKMYSQQLRSGERQLERWRSKRQKLPLAFQVEDEALSLRVVGWAASLSTDQRKVGAGV